MAVRPVFVAQGVKQRPIREIPITFKWHAGLALIQKQKSIDALHQAARALGIASVLEISSKSPAPLGVALSAFNLVATLPDGSTCSVECAYQGSKVTALGGPYVDLYRTSSLQAKKDLRVRQAPLVRFSFFGTQWPLTPQSLFYDWLYIAALCEPRNQRLIEEAVRYDGFTDIEFNPEKQISCQARAVGAVVGWVKSGVSRSEIADTLIDLLQTMEGDPGLTQGSLLA